MPVPPSGQRFPQTSRIKKSRDFAQVRQTGQRSVCGCLIANWRPLPTGQQARLGLVVSRKIGGAVIRSRARRLLRETFRRHRPELTRPVDLVLVARQSIAKNNLANVERDFRAILSRSGLLQP